MSDEDYIRLPLIVRGRVVAHALVDREDAHLGKMQWRLTRHGYAVRSEYEPTTMATWIRQLHRAVLALDRDDPLRVDHINRDKLDNRRANLRLVTFAENTQNRPSQRGSKSRFRGVSWNTEKRRWQATVGIDGRSVYLGRFTDEVEAAEAADDYRLTHMAFAEPDDELATLRQERPTDI